MMIMAVNVHTVASLVCVRSMSTNAASNVTIKTAMILSRIPLVTPKLEKFEELYYKYQSELERRLMWTFPAYFYFKKGTLAEHKFIKAQRGPISKQPGVWFPRGVPDLKHLRERSSKQNIVLPKNESSDEGDTRQPLDDASRPLVKNSIETEADSKNNTKSLERKLQRTLYLVVRSNNGTWTLPSFDAMPGKFLHEAAELGLRTIGGDQIHTWTVSPTPAAVLKSGNVFEFLIKSHILAGKFEPVDKTKCTEYAWLHKDEIKELLSENYYGSIAHLLSDI